MHMIDAGIEAGHVELHNESERPAHCVLPTRVVRNHTTHYATVVHLGRRKHVITKKSD